jgi:hypothetical protein
MSTEVFDSLDGVRLSVTYRSDELRFVVKDVEDTVIARLTLEEVKELYLNGVIENSIIHSMQHSFSVVKTVLDSKERKLILSCDEILKTLAFSPTEWNSLFVVLSVHLKGVVSF